MRLFLIAFICLLATPLCLAQQVKLQNFNKVSLASVYDGDTFKVYLACKYPIFCKAIPVRVRGVDCPEIRGGTPETKAAAKAAKAFTKQFLRGGIIGGKKQTGKYKIDARFNKVALADKIRRISELKPWIHLSNEEASAFLDRMENELPSKSLIFLDPPYYVKGASLYYNHFKDSDHAILANNVKRYSKHWIVSYDNVEQVRKLYKPYRSETYSLNYSVQAHYQGSEVMFFSKGLI